MDNINIKAYKDGSDIIVVFKNIAENKGLESILSAFLNGVTVEEVPALEAPTQEEAEIPEFLSEKNEAKTTTEPEVIEEEKEEISTITNLFEYVNVLKMIKEGKDKYQLLTTYNLKNDKTLAQAVVTEIDSYNTEELISLVNLLSEYIPEATQKRIKNQLEKGRLTSLNDCKPYQLKYIVRGLFSYDIQ